MKSIAFGQYYPANSPIHRMDPRAKVILTVLYIVCTFLCRNTLCFAALLLSAVFLTVLSRVPIGMILRSIRPLIVILTFTSLINVFMTKGERLLTPSWEIPLWGAHVWRIRIFAEGLWNALFMVVRIVALLIGTSVLLSYTTTPIALTDALERLFSPLKKIKVPVHDIAMMTTIALRFIPTLMDETQRIMNAQKARGADFTSGGLIKRAKALLPVLIPLLVSAFNRAYELASAMECRCYHGGEGRTRLKILHLRVSDVFAVLLLVAFGVGIFFLNRVGILYTMK
ncbi:MAG: energy-coupling factor transporter transmembrane protein EcfT [Clostridia bacterium]|nr:energy-coupling factor transporter transmembrane protein EcfT [Clostridia bacterium]MBQ3638942.1 energy-coupling factor transporter transmembrane protein EcfT [Clostridia bacterium]